MNAGSLSALVRRWKTLALDRLWYSKTVRLGAWAVFMIKSAVGRGLRHEAWGSHPAGIDEACSAARCADSDWQMKMAETMALRRMENLKPATVLLPKADDVVMVDKAAIFKPALPGGEKGVIFISFETNWQRLLSAGVEAVQELGRNYRFILAPTWSPPHSVVGCVFPRMVPLPVFTTISNVRDLEILPRISGRYRLLPLYASSWVNPGMFTPLPSARRDIDVIVLSNFARYKRHHVLFRALASITPAQRPRVMLVGQPDGLRTGEVLLKEAADFGVRDCIELRQRVSDAEVCELLCRSRCALITSRREGSCVAVVEAMMADTPVGLLRGAEIGSATFLNEQTGRLLDENNLAKELVRLIADSPSFAPREWVLKHGVDCHTSTSIANEALRKEALANGEPWTQDLWTLHWRPNPVLLDPAEEQLALAEAARICDDCGVHFGVFDGMH